MNSKFKDKLEGIRSRLSDIQSTAIALSEALAFSGYGGEVFTGTASLISCNIEFAVDDLRELVKKMAYA